VLVEIRTSTLGLSPISSYIEKASNTFQFAKLSMIDVIIVNAFLVKPRHQHGETAIGILGKTKLVGRLVGPRMRH
jgi:hypothetical protein